MTAVIDGEGRVFGTVNVIDLFVLLVFAAVVVAGVAVAAQGGAGPTAQQSFTFTGTVQPAVASAMADRQPTGEAVTHTAILEIGPPMEVYPERQQVYDDGKALTLVNGEPETVRQIRFVATLPVVVEDGTVRYEGDRLLIGQDYRLDLGYTIVDATLVDMEAGG